MISFDHKSNISALLGAGKWLSATPAFGGAEQFQPISQRLTFGADQPDDNYGWDCLEIDMTFTVYVLRSSKNGKRYVGFTSKDVNVRLNEHLIGSNKWTKQNGPFKIIHHEEYSEKVQAQRREKYLKSGHGREWLDKNILG